MGNFKSKFATDNRVESTIHFVNKYIRVATNKLNTKKVDSDYYVMTGDTVEAIINAYQNKNAKTALLVDDIGLQVVNRLKQEGIKDMTLVLTRLPEEHMPIVSEIIKRTFPDIPCKIISLKELTYMNVDLIIANPPYGKIGAEITKKIIDTIDFKEYINLLPLKDYKHNSATMNHIDFNSIKVLPPFSFNDADTITAICKLTKVANHIKTTIKELCANSFAVDEPMIKFMAANCAATHYAIDNLVPYTQDLDPARTVIFHCFMIGSNHNSGWPAISSTCTANKYNFNNEVSPEIMKKSGGSNFRCIVFNTPEEKINFVEFIKNNFSFSNRMQLNNMLSARNDSCCFPKVDWKRNDWTVEKLLTEVADYSKDEIKAVLDSDDKVHYFWGDPKFLKEQFPNRF